MLKRWDFGVEVVGASLKPIWVGYCKVWDVSGQRAFKVDHIAGNGCNESRNCVLVSVVFVVQRPCPSHP